MEKIPKTVSLRLARYLYALQTDFQEAEYVSSLQLAEALGATGAQVRKDLSYFQIAGKRGGGYERIRLMEDLKKVTGLNRHWPILVVGAGNLGKALTAYSGFSGPPLEVVAVFDVDPKKIGKNIGRTPILGLEQMKETAQRLNIQLGILRVPRTQAQLVAEKMVEAGLKAILNFAPLHLQLPKHIRTLQIDLASLFASLTFDLAGKRG